MGVADGGIVSICAGRLSVVPPLVAAVPAFDIDAATFGLDYQYFPDLRDLAHAVDRT